MIIGNLNAVFHDNRQLSCLLSFRKVWNNLRKYKRTLDLSKLLEMKSHFLFGARTTGKSTLIKDQIKGAILYDLLDDSTFRKLLKNPERLREELSAYQGYVVIDEIQKLPKLLDEVHWIIENLPIHFLLTGSSARKLKSKGVNLLAGRVWLTRLFPLTSLEIDDFDLDTYLNRGGLPNAYLSKAYKKELENYVSFYLREEIRAEALTRQVQAFSHFLDIMGRSNGEEINFSSFASDLGISRNGIKSYFEILEDTQVGFEVMGYQKTKKRKAISRSKFYLFDVGVANHLAKRRQVHKGDDSYGKVFEHFIAVELRAALSYQDIPSELSYWRSTSQMEVDFVVPGHFAVEVKTQDNFQNRHIKGIRALKEEGLDLTHYYIISHEPKKRVLDDGIIIIPYQEFLTQLWKGALFRKN